MSGRIAARLAALEHERRERARRAAWHVERAPVPPLEAAEAAFMEHLTESGDVDAAVRAAERAYGDARGDWWESGRPPEQEAAAARLPDPDRGPGRAVERSSDADLARIVLAGEGEGGDGDG